MKDITVNKKILQKRMEQFNYFFSLADVRPNLSVIKYIFTQKPDGISQMVNMILSNLQR